MVAYRKRRSYVGAFAIAQRTADQPLEDGARKEDRHIDIYLHNMIRTCEVSNGGVVHVNHWVASETKMTK